jgi:hypothetical protein
MPITVLSDYMMSCTTPSFQHTRELAQQTVLTQIKVSLYLEADKTTFGYAGMTGTGTFETKSIEGVLLLLDYPVIESLSVSHPDIWAHGDHAIYDKAAL